MLSRRHAIATLAAYSAVPSAVAASSDLNVVATTGMIADAVARIGAGAVSVQGLMGPGVDPHAYRQTRSNIVQLTRADLVLWHGLYLEAQMEEFLLKLGKRQPVFAVTDPLLEQPNALIASEDYSNRYDPHVWMDPVLWRGVALRVKELLAGAKPEAARIFEQNLADFLPQLEALTDYGKHALSCVPQQARVLVTAHDAFAYFGRAFDMDVIGVQGISTESEAGIFRIRELVDTLVDRKVSAVFVESSVSDQNIRALIEGAQARGHDIRLGGELYSDAMGPEGTYEGTYIGMMDHNITTIARALGAQVPVKGLNGRLAAGS